MKIAVLSIGNEILKGSISNTNLAGIGQELLFTGLTVSLEMCVNDDSDDIMKAFKFLCESGTEIIITTGGLGPTTDDITVETAAKYFGMKLYCDEGVVSDIESYLSKVIPGRLSKYNRKQAFVPEGAVILKNHNGTAPGIFIKKGSLKVFLLPGPPSEMKPMLTSYVIPEIMKGVKGEVYVEPIFTVGVAESELQKMVDEQIGSPEGVYIAYRAVPGMCELSFCGPDRNSVAFYSEKMRRHLGKAILLPGFKGIVEELLYTLKKNNLKLVTAESCTGGMIAARITDVPGASLSYSGGIVAYSNQLKQQFLGVRQEILDKYGAVSRECVLEMVEGVCTRFGADTGIAVTGIAGPEGGTPEKPVGLVYIAVKSGSKIEAKEYRLNGSRDRIRSRTVAYAFNMLRELLLM